MCQVFSDRLACHGHAIAMEKATVEQRLENDRCAADVVYILGEILAARLEIGDERCAREYFRDVK